MVIRVGLGVTEDLRLSSILEFLSINKFGADHLIETFKDYATIADDIENMREVEEDPDFNNSTFYEKVQYWISLIGQYLRYVGNTVMLLIRFIEMLIIELVYLLKIVVYLVFGVSF